MNILSRDKQIEVIAALSEGMSIRSVERLTGVHRDTIMRLGAPRRPGCAELHDRMMVGLRVARIECDEMWAYVGCKQKNVTAPTSPEGRSVHFHRAGGLDKGHRRLPHRQADSENTDLFIRDLRERILGTPEISTDGFHPYRIAIRDAFGDRARAWRHQQDLLRDGSAQGRSAPLLAGRGSSSKP